MKLPSVCKSSAPIIPLGLMAIIAAVSASHASVFDFDLEGKAGAGVLAGNENGTVFGTPGSGGEVGVGISYDDVSNLLTINIAWGTGNGFTDLTGVTTGGHLHGPTTSGGVASFTENASVAYGLNSLGGWNSSATDGGFSGTISISEAHEPALLNGQFYFNVHTSTNPGGEIRANLVAVPEPAETAMLFGGMIGAFALVRRLRTRN